MKPTCFRLVLLLLLVMSNIIHPIEYSLELLKQRAEISTLPLVEIMQVLPAPLDSKKVIEIQDECYPAFLYIYLDKGTCSIYNQLPCSVHELSCKSLSQLCAALILFDNNTGPRLITKYHKWRRSFEKAFLENMFASLCAFKERYYQDTDQSVKVLKAVKALQSTIATISERFDFESNFLR